MILLTENVLNAALDKARQAGQLAIRKAGLWRIPLFQARAPVRALLMVGLLGASLPGAAQMLHLPVVMQEAMATHPRLKSQRAELQAVLATLEGTRWSRYPSVSANLESASGGLTTVLRLEQPIWTGGLIGAQIELAQARVGQAQASLLEAEQAVLRDIAVAFLETLRLEARLRVALINEEEHRKLHTIILRRVQAEVSPATDATQGGVRLHQSTNERLLIERQLQSVRHTLEQLLGRAPGELVVPPDMLNRERTEQSFLDAALAFSPERRRLLAELAVADADIAIARAQIKPKLVAGYALQNYPGTTGGGTQGKAYIALQVQTGAGLSALSAVESAVARRQAVEDAVETHERDLRQQVRTTWSEIQALEQQVVPIRALVAGADEIMASYLRQFQVSRKSWLDVLNAQREKAQASYALTDIELPLKLLHLRLLILTGDINANHIPLTHDNF